MKRFRGGLVCKAHRFLYHSTLGSRVIKKNKTPGEQNLGERSEKRIVGGLAVSVDVHPLRVPRHLIPAEREREFFIDNLLARIHLINKMVVYTCNHSESESVGGLAVSVDVHPLRVPRHLIPAPILNQSDTLCAPSDSPRRAPRHHLTHLAHHVRVN